MSLHDIRFVDPGSGVAGCTACHVASAVAAVHPPILARL